MSKNVVNEALEYFSFCFLILLLNWCKLNSMCFYFCFPMNLLALFSILFLTFNIFSCVKVNIIKCWTYKTIILDKPNKISYYVYSYVIFTTKWNIINPSFPFLPLCVKFQKESNLDIDIGEYVNIKISIL